MPETRGEEERGEQPDGLGEKFRRKKIDAHDRKHAKNGGGDSRASSALLPFIPSSWYRLGGVASKS